MRNLKAVKCLLLFIAVLMVSSTVFAGDKKISVCMSYGDTESLVAYGGLEIEARCDVDEGPEVWMISNVANTRTSDGFWLEPTEFEMFDYETVGDCNNDIDDGSMYSEKGEYLAIDGETLVLCREVMDCDCSVTGIVVKQKIKLKVPKVPK